MTVDFAFLFTADRSSDSSENGNKARRYLYLYEGMSMDVVDTKIPVQVWFII